MATDQRLNILILIVEDSATQALKLQYLLEGQGYAVVVRGNGREAMDYLNSEKHAPTMIISDIMMPEVDGYELCRRIRESDHLKQVPVLLLSTLSEPEDIIRGLSSGANNFLIKPYNEKQLLSRLQYILVNRELRGSSQREMSIEVFFNGKKHLITSDRFQILDLLFSTYDNVVKQYRELERVNKELKKALATIDALQGILPICSSCKKIRDEENEWQLLESYISDRSEAKFSHGICPDCARRLYPDVYQDK